MIRLLTEIRATGKTPGTTDTDVAVNREIAAHLRIAADQLQSRDANPYRAASFRIAADTVAAQPRSLRAIYDERGRDGLHALPGVGPGIAAIIGDILRTRRRAEAADKPCSRASYPPVQLVLEADREYRTQARADKLASPGADRAQSAGRELRMERDGWHLRIFFSNSARAQELARTRDWVIVIASRGDRPECQHTVVTETRGKLAGRRVVRGRETACRTHYTRMANSAASRGH